MKKLLFTMVVSFMVGASALAQEVTKEQSLEQRASDLTRSMANELRLNESEYIKLKALNRDRLTRIDETLNRYSNDPGMRQAKLREINANFEANLTPILSKSQREAFMEYKQTNREFKRYAGTEETESEMQTPQDNR